MLALVLSLCACETISRTLSGADENSVPIWRPIAGSKRNTPDKDYASCQSVHLNDPGAIDLCMLARGYEKVDQ